MVFRKVHGGEADPLVFRRRFFLLLILCGTGLYFFANIQRVAVPGAIFDLLQSDLHLSAPGVTALGSVFMYVYALNQLLIGLFVSRYGGRRVILPGGFLCCLGSLCFPLSSGGVALFQPGTDRIRGKFALSGAH